ncbi:50S ribosomal protein L29 [Candidatus Micrarchaeota archaeon]|nr:50S ribosomal protein L29 [Candidatus Micrarchaeota archaeon]
MAIIQKSKLKEMTATDMQTELSKVRSELRAEIAAKGSGQKPKNPGRYKQLRRMIARLITKLNQKGIRTE